MLTRQMVSVWLWNKVDVTPDKRYRHRVIKENPSRRSQIIVELTAYVQAAHEDARNRLRKIAYNPLDPLGFVPNCDAAEGYPALLHMQTLKGYFGEIFAGLIAEYLSPFGVSNWKVPAYLFRFHLVAMQHFERIRRTGEPAHPIPGRTGDDCLAFQMNDQGEIISALYCEAKCTQDHDTGMIAEAHEKVSQAVIVDIPQLIEVLQDKDDPDSVRWVDALRQLEFGEPDPQFERYDLVSYVCRAPKRNDNWLSPDNPHPKYIGGRKLEAVEVHLPNVEELIRVVYSKEKKDERGPIKVASSKKDEKSDTAK